MHCVAQAGRGRGQLTGTVVCWSESFPVTILDSRFPFCMAQQIDLVSVFSLCLSFSQGSAWRRRRCRTQSHYIMCIYNSFVVCCLICKLALTLSQRHSWNLLENRRRFPCLARNHGPATWNSHLILSVCVCVCVFGSWRSKLDGQLMGSLLNCKWNCGISGHGWDL